MKNILLSIAAGLSMLACSGNGSEIVMVAGTYTNTGSTGLYSFVFNEDTGDYRILDSCRTTNPSYLTFSEDGNIVYAVGELDEGDGAVTAFEFNRENGSFRKMSTEATLGAAPCYIATNGKVVVTANFFGGSMSVIPISDDGGVLPVLNVYNGSMGGPDAERQEAPHVHCAVFSPDGNYLYATDFSADRILYFHVYSEGRSIIPRYDDNLEQCYASVLPDYGPRHLIFDNSGTHAYVIGELSGLITVFDVADEGYLVSKQTIDADPFDGRGSADIHLSPDGRYLYASNRLEGDGIAIFEVDSQTGELTAAGYCQTGIHPRHFNITPNGKFLLCACRDTNEIEIYRRDADSGQLTHTGKTIPLKKPVCVQFLK